MDNYEIIDQVGEGAHGIVFKATQVDTAQLVAIKRIHIKHNSMPVSLLREIKALQHLDHVNIISLHHVFQHDFAFNLCFEYVPYDLSHMIPKRPSALHIKSWMYMLLSGIMYMHANNVVHRDLKPANLLISHTGVLKIADFGQARLLLLSDTEDPTSAPLSHQVATRFFRAPELLYGSRSYSNAVDLWATGCIFGELLNCKPLFPGQNDIDQLYVVLSSLGSPTEQDWPDMHDLPDYGKIIFPDFPKKPIADLIPNVSPITLDLVRRFLVYYGPARISAHAALQHAYFATAPFASSELCMDALLSSPE